MIITQRTLSENEESGIGRCILKTALEYVTDACPQTESIILQPALLHGKVENICWRGKSEIYVVSLGQNAHVPFHLPTMLETECIIEGKEAHRP